MKVNQIVREHTKGMRAKKYARKPINTIAPKKPEGPKPAEQKKPVNEGAIDKLFGQWINSEDAPYDDDSGDYNAVYDKAVRFLNGRVDPKYIDNFANALVSHFHGEDDLEPMDVGDALDEVGEDIASMTGTSGKVIANDGKTITVAMPDGTQIQKPIGPNMLATDPQGKPVVNLNTQQPGSPAPTQPQQNPQDMFAKGKDITVNTGKPVEEELATIRKLSGL